jgi:hypothetical protein
MFETLLVTPVRHDTGRPGSGVSRGSARLHCHENALINTLELPLAVALVWIYLHQISTGSSLLGGIIMADENVIDVVCNSIFRFGTGGCREQERSLNSSFKSPCGWHAHAQVRNHNSFK